MAAGSFVEYTKAVLEMGQGAFNLGSDTYIMALFTSSYTPAPNSDAVWSDISANEVATGGGYTAGGAVLSGVTWTQSTATNTFTCTAPTWSSFTATFKYAVIVRRAGGSVTGTDKLLCYFDANSGGGSVTGGGGTLTITPNASGIFTATHSP